MPIALSDRSTSEEKAPRAKNPGFGDNLNTPRGLFIQNVHRILLNYFLCTSFHYFRHEEIINQPFTSAIYHLIPLNTQS